MAAGAHATARVRSVAVLDHAPGEDPEQEVEQVVGVATHKRARQQNRLARFRCQHSHGLALGRTAVLVLVSLVYNQQVEVALRQHPLDELGRLLAVLAEAECQVGHRPLHTLGLAVAEDEVALGVHQIDELVDVVSQHRSEKRFAEVRNQLLGPDGADGG